MSDEKAKAMQELFMMGREETPEQFLYARVDWLERTHGLPPPVRIQPVGDGWDVVMRIDGVYFNKDDAERIAEAFAAEVEGIRQRLLENPPA